MVTIDIERPVNRRNARPHAQFSGGGGTVDVLIRITNKNKDVVNMLASLP